MGARSSVIAAIKYNLQQITVAHGYLTDVAAVEHRVAVPSEMPASGRTWVGFRVGPEETEWGSFYEGMTEARVIILCLLPRQATADLMATAADNFLRDVKRRFMSVDNGLRGAGAAPTAMETLVDKRDADNTDMTAGGDQVLVELKVRYYETATD